MATSRVRGRHSLSVTMYLLMFEQCEYKVLSFFVFLFVFFFLSFCLFVFSRAASTAYGGSQAWV